jgi:2,3-bisphosphoglycerate-dependent phosphoglycerate mutase
MPTLVLVRHGQSQWNLENRFTGWHDVNLTTRGEAEARQAGVLIRQTGLVFAQAFTSMQTRAIRTLWLALEGMDACWLPEEKSWRLNERHYGALTGLNKAETAERHGAAQVHEWRRSYDIPPPALEASDPRHPAHDARYAGIPRSQLPATESLKTTLERVLPYWDGAITPALQAGNVLIAAHGNSLRAIVKHLFQVADNAITDVEIPTGNPLLIELDQGLVPVGARYLDAERATSLPDLPASV